MLENYRRKEVVKAEQYDGSQDVVDRYGNPDFDYSLETFKGYYSWDKDNSVWIATGVDDEHWIIDDDIFKKSYTEKKDGMNHM